MKIVKQGVTIELELDEVKQLINDNFNEEEFMDLMNHCTNRLLHFRFIAERFFDDYKDEIEEHYPDYIKTLVHHLDTTVGLYATDMDAGELFNECFKNGISLKDDTMTLSGLDYEEMDNKWIEFCKTKFHQISK